MRVACVTDCVSGCVARCRGVRPGCMVDAFKKLGVWLATYRLTGFYRWMSKKLVAIKLDLGVLLAANTSKKRAIKLGVWRTASKHNQRAANYLSAVMPNISCPPSSKTTQSSKIGRTQNTWASISIGTTPENESTSPCWARHPQTFQPCCPQKTTGSTLPPHQAQVQAEGAVCQGHRRLAPPLLDR